MKASEKKLPEAHLLITGSGGAKSSVIIAGLHDMLTSYNVRSVTTVWYEYAPGMQVVQEFLMDNTIPWRIVAANPSSVPKRYEKFAEDVVYVDLGDDQIIEEAALVAPGSLDLADDHVIALLLWDDNNLGNMEDFVVAADASGISVLDLTNGLVPIVLEDDETEPETEPEPAHETAPAPEPAKKQKEVDSVEVADQPFTKEELLSMPLAALKRMATAQGIQVPAGVTKAVLADLLDGYTVDVEVDVYEGAEEVRPELRVVEAMPQKDTNVVEIPIAGHPSMLPTPVAGVVVYSSGASIVLNMDSPLRQIVESVLKQYTNHNM